MSYTDPGWLYERYWDDELSASKMSDLADCSDETILRYMRKFDIPRRGMSDAVSVGKRREVVPFHTVGRGYEYWRGSHKGKTEGRVAVHRLAAVAWFGWDAVVDKAIHHKNSIPWDNREKNIEPLGFDEHIAEHESWLTSPIQDW